MLIYASSTIPASHSFASWQPILVGGERDRALELVREIAIAVRDYRVSEPSLLGGAGIAVFCAYAEAAGVVENLDVAGMLAACVERAGETCLPIGLWNGCAGLRWTIAHLADGEVADVITARLDAAVARALADAPVAMSFDLYSGLAGVLLAYAEDRSTTGQAIASTVIERLSAIDWTSAQRLPGCAHGLAGVVAALACWLVAQPEPQTQPTQAVQATRAMQMATADCETWQLDTEAPHDQESQQTICRNDDCHVATSVACDRARHVLRTIIRQLTIPKATAAHASAIDASWCSGGPGVAFALLSASHALADDELAHHARRTMHTAFESAAVPPDAALCHGAAGLAHLCNRLYQATGDGELGERARGWLRRTWEAHRPGTGVAGFRRLRRKPTAQWHADPSLLVGAAGIGLTLLAAATPVAPLWDRTLAADVCQLAAERTVRD